VRPLIIALVVFVCNRRDGRVATFRPIPQSVSGVGVRFSIGHKIRNLGEKSFCLTRRQRKFFILLWCCSHFCFFILTELGVGIIVGNVVAFLWRGAWGGFGGLAWHKRRKTLATQEREIEINFKGTIHKVQRKNEKPSPLALVVWQLERKHIGCRFVRIPSTKVHSVSD
jgi:hypothetical protein